MLGYAYVGEDGGSETSDDTRREGDAELRGGREGGPLLGAHTVVDELGTSFIDSELAWAQLARASAVGEGSVGPTDGVGDLLEQDRDEAGVQRPNTFCRGDLGEP